MLYDSGAIYLLDRGHRSTGNVVSNNYIDGNGSTTQSTKAVYLDDDASNVTISGNYCRNCGQYAVQYHGGDHLVVTDNVFDLSSGAKVGLYQDDLDPAGNLPNYGMSGNTFSHNTVYFSGGGPATLWDFDDNYGGRNVAIALPEVSANLYFSASGAAIPNGGVIVDSSPSYGAPSYAAQPTDQGPRALPAALP